MDMSRSSEYRINEAVNILKTMEQLEKSGTKVDRDKLDLINFSLVTKFKNPNMLLANRDESSFVPHILTHQEYKYMAEHIEELMGEETNSSTEPTEPTEPTQH